MLSWVFTLSASTAARLPIWSPPVPLWWGTRASLRHVCPAWWPAYNWAILRQALTTSRHLSRRVTGVNSQVTPSEILLASCLQSCSIKWCLLGRQKEKQYASQDGKNKVQQILPLSSSQWQWRTIQTSQTIGTILVVSYDPNSYLNRKVLFLATIFKWLGRFIVMEYFNIKLI